MTLLPTEKSLFGNTLKQFDQFFVGFDNQFSRIDKLYNDLTKNIANYPPYNIRKVDDNNYIVEIAVAGFSKSDLDIDLFDGKLTVTGRSTKTATEDYLHKGIGTRDFTRTFVVDVSIVVKGASLKDGMLRINLERIVPDNKKSTKIEINETNA